MKKERFKALSWSERVKVINAAVKAGEASGPKAYFHDVLGVDHSSYLSAIKKLGYIYDREAKQLKLNTDKTSAPAVHKKNTEPKATPAKEPKAKTDGPTPDKVHKKSTKSMTGAHRQYANSAPEVHKERTESAPTELIPHERDALNNFINMQGKLQRLIEWFDRQATTEATTAEVKVNADLLVGHYVPKSFRIHEDVLSRFLEFAKLNRVYDLQHLLSQAVLEFMEKYKR